MSDICDRAQPVIEAELERALSARSFVPMAQGWPGECDFCGEYSPRLVNGFCARCRDGRHK